MTLRELETAHRVNISARELRNLRRAIRQATGSDQKPVNAPPDWDAKRDAENIMVSASLFVMWSSHDPYWFDFTRAWATAFAVSTAGVFWWREIRES